MADPNTKVELGAEVDAKAESPRTPRISIAEGLRKFIRELGAVFGLKMLARAGTPEGQRDAQVFGLAKSAREAGLAHGDGPGELREYQLGAESALSGEQRAA